MTEFGDRPAIGGVALRAVLTKQCEMAVIIGVAGGAVEHNLCGRDTRMRWSPAAGPGDEFFAQEGVFAIKGPAIELS